MSPPSVSLAFLGCGAATRTHSGVLSRFGSAVRRYYASRDSKSAEEYNRKYKGAGTFRSYAEAMADERVQAVVVATPPDSHLELALAALEARKHVVLEKPAFLRAADFDVVGSAEARSGRRLMVAENYCYKPLARVLREVIASGALGQVLYFHLVAVKSQRRAGWRDDPAVAGGGALFEGGVHWIDLLANVGLEVESARGFRPGHGAGLERSMLLVVKYKEGGVGTLAHSWEVPSPLHGLRVSRIYGTRGSAAFESNGIVVLVSGARRRLVFPGLRDINGNRAMWADFLDVIRTGREPVMTAVRARRGLELVETAYRTAVDTHEAIR
ncbi:MAG: Gfo/Idh/MocA family oxidoreductase [Gemmatimonadales bacterium]|nr:Gfo/Idh/MocA family oxidoreductase [Gemmatimonadales bacterium]